MLAVSFAHGPVDLEIYTCSYAPNLDLRQWHRVLLAAARFPGKIKADVCN